MKIVVIGGTGLIGSKSVAILRQGGHEVIAASPKVGVNTITADGLKEALAGAHVVIDLSDSLSFDLKGGVVRRTPRRLIEDGLAADAHSAFGRRYPTLIECMSKRNFKFRPLHPILKSTGLAEHAATSTSIEAIAPTRRAAGGQQGRPP